MNYINIFFFFPDLRKNTPSGFRTWFQNILEQIKYLEKQEISKGFLCKSLLNIKEVTGGHKDKKYFQAAKNNQAP